MSDEQDYFSVNYWMNTSYALYLSYSVFSHLIFIIEQTLAIGFFPFAFWQSSSTEEGCYSVLIEVFTQNILAQRSSLDCNEGDIPRRSRADTGKFPLSKVTNKICGINTITSTSLSSCSQLSAVHPSTQQPFFDDSPTYSLTVILLPYFDSMKERC